MLSTTGRTNSRKPPTSTTTPSFVAPDVALGGETLSFQLTVEVTKANNAPFADAGPD
jgi:hypothetical protein